MKTLILILSILSQHGVSLNDFDITTVPSTEQLEVYDCDAFVDDATIVVCVDTREIIIIQD